MTFAGMYQAGQLTGNGPADKGLKQNWINSGWKPNHLYIGNVGFGTTNAQIAADSNNEKVINAGIVTANYVYGKLLGNSDSSRNTTAGTIPIALDDAVEEKMLEKGDILLFAAFGGGFTWGSMLIKWD